MRLLTLLAALLISSPSLASPVAMPSWASEETRILAFSGSIGSIDADVVVPQRHPALGGLPIGRAWFAAATSDELNLSAWEGFAEPNEMLGFVALGVALQGGGTGLPGTVRPDGGIYVCVSGINDTGCARNVSSPFSAYTIAIYLAPGGEPAPVGAAVPEPTPIGILALGLIAAALACPRRGRP